MTMKTLLALGAAGLGGYVIYRLLQPDPRKPIPCSEPIPYGDIDNDGWITQKDADLITQHGIGAIILESWQVQRANVNDYTGPLPMPPADWFQQAATIQLYLAGAITTFRICLP